MNSLGDVYKRQELCKRDDIDLVYIATDWLHHFPVAKCALENGKNVAIAYDWLYDARCV